MIIKRGGDRDAAEKELLIRYLEENGSARNEPFLGEFVFSRKGRLQSVLTTQERDLNPDCRARDTDMSLQIPSRELRIPRL